MNAPPVPHLTVHTQPLDAGDLDGAGLLDLVPADVRPADLTCWLRDGDGLVGWGRAASTPPRGTGRFTDAEAWWQRLVDAAVVVDEVGLPGSGLVAFGSFSFSASSPRGSALVVPRVVIGRRDGVAWVTRIGLEPDRDSTPIHAQDHTATPRRVEVHDGQVPAASWPGVITEAVTRIRRTAAADGSGDADPLAKIVLARDLLARADGPLDPLDILDRLRSRYTQTWTFAVDGLVGATPEMLVRVRGGEIRSRVLAGTVPRTADPESAHVLAALTAGARGAADTQAHPTGGGRPGEADPRMRLASSAKELQEHAYAVRSVAEALAPHLAALDVPDTPYVLDLPDVHHLASDLSGTAGDGVTALRLVGALHPSAAVCGTPTTTAMRLIPTLEGIDRGRYAGPVGWVDAGGNGDWGIALRCGQLDPRAEHPHDIQLFAGGGIVADSDPEAELAETEVKFTAMRHALRVDDS